jgi:hypothetical protein
VFPFIGPEFVAALVARRARKADSSLPHRSSKAPAVTGISGGGAGSKSDPRQRVLLGDRNLIKFTAFMRRRPGLTHETLAGTTLAGLWRGR